MSHAQIIVGEADSVRAYARVIACAVNCLEFSKQTTPCGSCISCKVFETGNHPDTFYVTKTKQSGIGVDDVRSQIISPMSTKPFSYNFKVFIIDKAETLTPAAQSALLKTIEEPAPYGFFLFLAPHVHNFLPTILSRCHVHKISGYSQTPHNQELKTVAQEIIDIINSCDILGALTLYKKFEPYKESKENLQELLDLIYHIYGEEISKSTRAGGLPQQEWLNAISAITHTKAVLSQNGNTQLAIELMLINIVSRKGQQT